jgi:putative endonuclease
MAYFSTLILTTVKELPLYTVYIMASRSLTLYIGVTRDLGRRTIEHKQHAIEGFTSKYRVERLVYYERFVDIRAAIAREKQLKGWRRHKKIALIRSRNPTWIDLSEEWGKPIQAVSGPFIRSDR